MHAAKTWAVTKAGKLSLPLGAASASQNPSLWTGLMSVVGRLRAVRNGWKADIAKPGQLCSLQRKCAQPFVFLARTISAESLSPDACADWRRHAAIFAWYLYRPED